MTDAQLAQELQLRSDQKVEALENYIRCLEGHPPPGQDMELININRYVYMLFPDLLPLLSFLSHDGC